MLKKILAVFFFIGSAAPAFAETPRGLFVSVVREPTVFSSPEEFKELLEFAKKTRVKTLFVQIYRENKSWFPSQVADMSPYKTAYEVFSEDPFSLLIRQAHAEGIQVHAWINLLSLGANAKAPLLKKFGPQILAQNRVKKRFLLSYQIDSQFFLEPGDPRVRRVLVTVVEEILSRYPDLDGIQFDYIRYPDVHPDYGYAAANVERYRAATGRSPEKESVDWKKWKMEQVTGLVRLLADKARAIKPRIQISATGLVPYARARLESFQDWQGWVKTDLVDFVTLMAYPPTTPGYRKYVRDAKNRLGSLSHANLAVGAYKLAGFPSTFERQWGVCEESGARSCVAFHYGSFSENRALQSILEKKQISPVP